MNRFPIFAAIDSTGATRFVGDVPRGAACGCRCAACGSPLVARRGEERIWHFAHEASQERPECYSGAINLLRRVAIERLRVNGLPPPPIYRTTVYARPPLPQLPQAVEWAPGPWTAEEWADRPTQHAPVARLRMASGTKVFLFVEVTDQPTVTAPLMPPDDGIVFLHLPLPSRAEDFKDLEAVSQFIDTAARLAWVRMPDARGAIVQAVLQAEARARAMRDERQARQAQWSSAAPRPQLAPLQVTPPPAAPAAPVDASPWAAWRKPGAFVFYGLKDGSGWALFTHSDGREVMAPWPTFDGWDEAMPPKVGQADLELGVYVLRDQVQAMMFLGSLSRKVTTASTWADLVAIQWPPPSA